MSYELAFMIDLGVEVADMRADAIAGLSQAQKSIPPKYFYDEVGADLFVQITETPEYYPTRSEAVLLRSIATEVAQWAGSGASLIEPGSGAAEKAQILLEAMDRPHEYVLMDISAEQLRASGTAVKAAFSRLRVGAVSGDFTVAMPSPGDVFTGTGKRICFFPGSTIGNFGPNQQVDLLRAFKSVLRSGDAILLGADGVKDTSRLDAAYNDASGLTAAFNLNLLARMKRELDAKLEETAFQHLAFYNPAYQRIEMHLVAPHGARIEIGDLGFELAPGETIHTENSWKFDRARLAVLSDQAGLILDHVWEAQNTPYYLALLKVP